MILGNQNVTTPQTILNSESGLETPLILGIVFASVCFLLLIGCIISKYLNKGCSKKVNSSNGGEKAKVQNKAIGNLIPPIFYTDKVKDPLLQEDLSDHALQKYQKFDP